MFLRLFIIFTTMMIKFIVFLLKLCFTRKSLPKLLIDLIVSLGPVYIKMGQILSTRRDWFSPKYIEELSRLRDDVPREDNRNMMAAIDNSYPQGRDKVFASFNEEPIAAGTFAHTYLAKLHSGERVAVKVLRTGIKESVEKNFLIISLIARFLEKVSRNLKTINLTGNIREMEDLLLAHTDLENEIKNYKKFADIFKDNENVIIPEVFEEISNSRILVTEYVDDIPPYEFERLGIETSILAKSIDDMLDDMLFLKGLLHADLHPGNFFWNKNGQLVLIDFGMAHQFSMEERNHIMTFYYSIIEGYYDFSTEYLLKYFVYRVDAPDGLTDELYNLVYISIYEFFIESDGKLDFSAEFFKILKIISKYRIVIKPNYYKALLTLASIEGYLYYIDPGFNMIENARKRRLKMAEYAAIPEEAVRIILGNFGTYSNPIFHKGFKPEKAYKERDRFILNEIDLKEGQFVIDVGCGRGNLLKKIERKEGVRALGITVSKTEYEACIKKGLECKWTSWEEFDNINNKNYPKADSMTVIEMLLHIGTMHENKVGLVERRLEKFFSWAYDKLADNGRLFIQSLNITGDFLHDSTYEEYYERVNTLLPWLGFTTFRQIVECSEKYFTIERAYNHSVDLLPTSNFIKNRINENRGALKKIIKPFIFNYMKEELDIGIELADKGIVKLYRTLMVKKSNIIS